LDLAQLANLGEFIGGLAVIVTLIYLALQVRLNTRALGRSNARQTALQNSDALRDWVTHAELFIDGFNKLPERTPAERLKFTLILVIWFQGIEQALEDEREGSHDPGFSVPYRMFIRGMLSTEEGKAWWDQTRIYFSPQFQGEVDEMANEGSEELAKAFRNVMLSGSPAGGFAEPSPAS
jgi:hypothetical protein